MSRESMTTAVRRWAPIAAALLALGAWSARLESAVEQKAPAADVAEIRGQLTAIQNQLEDMAARQRQYFCSGKADWCR